MNVVHANKLASMVFTLLYSE